MAGSSGVRGRVPAVEDTVSPTAREQQDQDAPEKDTSDKDGRHGGGHKGATADAARTANADVDARCAGRRRCSRW